MTFYPFLLHFGGCGGGAVSEPAPALTSELSFSGLRMVVNLPQSWRMAMTQQLMSPTYPITTWSPSRRTFWTESLVGPHLPRPLTAGSAPAAGAPLLPQAGVGGCLCGDGAREPWVSCQWSSGAFWSEGQPQGLPQAGARSPGPRMACCFSARRHQPVSACLGLTPHPCVGEPQVPAGHADARTDTQGLALPPFAVTASWGGALPLVQCPAWPPGHP